ncbi:MAG: M14 family zinc carboxypeptidase, partial [Gemmatimonadota bacterium]
MNRSRIPAAAFLAALCIAAAPFPGLQEATGQEGIGSDPPHTLDLTWDRWMSHEEIGQRMELMARTWPRFLTLSSMGNSYGGRELWVMTINNPDTGPEMNKAGMFIEADVHGNEVQGSEVCLYTIWYLMENYDRNPEIRRLVDERVFYIVPTINPDGRDFFLYGTGSGARTGHVPVDSDGDGLFDEDGPDDLNGNGVIEQIRKYVPGEGTHRLNPR